MYNVEMDATTLSAHEKLSKLEELVQEKDQLLSIVTERLEQAVEQLDRFRREGTQPTFDELAQSSVVENDADLRGNLKDDLRQMLDDWQDLQQRGWFDQLMTRLESLQSGVARADSSTDSRLASPVESQAKPSGSPKDDSGSYSSSVADILSRYGMETPKEPEPQSKPPVEPTYGGDTVVKSSAVTRSDRDTISERMLVPLPPSPESVDLETSDLATLRAAVVARDYYIAQLEDYLQTMEATAQQPVDFPCLDDLTDQQRQLLNQWSESIRKEFRQTQIQISLERAQLSRETMKLQHRQNLVESELKRLDMARRAGLIGLDDELSEGSKSRGWMGLFGGK
ncbi:MAG: hypothetical protein JWM11_1804 [Planctomycetaceae bacterium]|nr:hypothetical protein [Planctomycetaceae bacterium]